MPELSPSSITSDLTDHLEEACLPGGVSDVAIKVSLNLFTLNDGRALCNKWEEGMYHVYMAKYKKWSYK